MSLGRKNIPNIPKIISYYTTNNLSPARIASTPK